MEQQERIRKIISARETQQRTNLSRTTLWRLEKAGRFPRRKQLTSRRVGWDALEVDDWIQSRDRVLASGELL